MYGGCLNADPEKLEENINLKKQFTDLTPVQIRFDRKNSMHGQVIAMECVGFYNKITPHRHRFVEGKKKFF